MSTINATTNLYIKQDLNGIFKHSNDKSLWTDIPSFPLLISNTSTNGDVLTVRFETDLTITANNKYFEIGSDNITIDGNSNNVTITDVTDYLGLIQNGTSGINGKSHITVKNINTHSSNSSLAAGGGWICQNEFSRVASNNKIENCSNTGAVNSNYSGGICGASAAISPQGHVILTNCSNTGVVSGENAGGICGSNVAGFGGNFSLINCYNTGAVFGSAAGGICGSNAGSDGTCTITNCYNTGVVSGNYAGGICGFDAGFNGNCTLITCYTLYGALSETPFTGFVIVDCYTAHGPWTDSDANLALFGNQPISLPSPWFSVSFNTPYILSSFNREIYSVRPITGSVPFSSPSGLFVSPASLGVAYNYKLIGFSPVAGVSINANTGVIDFGVSMSNGPYALNVLVYKYSSGIYYDYNFNNLTVEIVAPAPSPPLISNICFPAGTPISCNEGVIAIENLNLNIHKIRNKKIVGITKTISQDNFLVCFEKNALGSNVPCAKTIISKNHSIFYDGKMLKAKSFIEMNDKVYKVKYKGEVLYNVLMESHDKMVVNNLICETLDPNNCVAKLYKILQGLSLNEQVDLINAYNDVVIKHKIYR